MKTIKFDVKIIGEISEYTLSNFVESCTGKKEINILLYSSGGQAESAWAIKNFIESHHIKTNIFCIGKIESAAIIILSAGTKKYAYKNTTFMYHLGIAGGGKIEDHEKHLKKVEYFNKIYREIIPKKVKLNHYPTYLTAKEALKLKVIDKII